jgi:hypothetical protein
MIIGWGISGNGGKKHKDYARKVSGIMQLVESCTNRQQIVDGSIENHDIGGYEYAPTAEDLLHRHQGVKVADELTVGALNVWNLPFCSIGPLPSQQDRKRF